MGGGSCREWKSWKGVRRGGEGGGFGSGRRRMVGESGILRDEGGG